MCRRTVIGRTGGLPRPRWLSDLATADQGPPTRAGSGLPCGRRRRASAQRFPTRPGCVAGARAVMSGERGVFSRTVGAGHVGPQPGSDGLEQIAAGTSRRARLEVVGVFGDGEHEHDRLWRARPDLGDGPDPVARHRDVEEADVGVLRDGEPDRFVGRANVAADPPSVLFQGGADSLRIAGWSSAMSTEGGVVTAGSPRSSCLARVRTRPGRPRRATRCAHACWSGRSPRGSSGSLGRSRRRRR